MVAPAGAGIAGRAMPWAIGSPTTPWSARRPRDGLGGATVLALALGLPAIALGPLAFAAFVAPSEWVRRRAAGRLADRRAALLPFVERLAALAGAGMTVEKAVLRLADPESPLRPMLREVASNRLLLRHGIDIDRRPEAAEAILGQPAWSWLRPDQ